MNISMWRAAASSIRQDCMFQSPSLTLTDTPSCSPALSGLAAWVGCCGLQEAAQLDVQISRRYSFTLTALLHLACTFALSSDTATLEA